MSRSLQVLSTLLELFCEAASICLSNLMSYFLDGRAEALLCASNMFQPACFNRLRKRKKMISEWNCCGKRVSFLVLTVACSSQSDVLQHLHNGTSHHLLLYKWALFFFTQPTGQNLGYIMSQHSLSACSDMKTEVAFGNDVGHYLDFEILHFGQISELWPGRKLSCNNWSMTWSIYSFKNTNH